MGTPTIVQVLDLSTHHLPEDLGSDGLGTVEGVVAYELPYGWLMWVPSDAEQMAEARQRVRRAEVLRVLEYAHRLGCRYVLFDSDADRVDDLPEWSW